MRTAHETAEKGPVHHRGECAQGGLKRSSQHDLCRLIGETGQAPLRVSSNLAGLSGPRAGGGGHGCNFVGAVHAEIGPFGEVLVQQSVSVLVASSPLPWAARIAVVDPTRPPRFWRRVLGHLQLPDPKSATWRSCSGKVTIVRVMASRTASAP